MILPFSLVLMRKTHQVLNKEQAELINITRNEVSLERMILRVSYQDAMLLNNSINFQLEQLGQGQEKTEEEKKEEEKEETGPEGVMPQILHQNSGIDDKMCVICYDNTKSVGFLPCKHMCCCKTCALGLVKKAPKCPLCRADI
mmetsp:Transcript_20211/g.17405  ORF Transcript_20211/g.17405 Transcript_20211/m.17405 type:complete len:143 (+) Transcript_20211:412-840(+)